jgi:hypothetical protein
MMAMSIRGVFIGVAALVSAAALAPAAWAGCGDPLVKAPASWGGTRGQADALLTQVNLGTPSIVGMWSVSFTAGGAVIDFGYSQWHSDGTEIMNSGGHTPASGNFCLGVWTQTGAFSYKLNHFALAYDPGTGALVAKINIKEDVVLDPKAMAFSGPFSIDAYNPTTGALLQHVGGQVTGHRITVN